MSRSSRIIAVVGTLVVLVIAFFVLSPGGSDEPATTTTTARGSAPGPATTTVAPAASPNLATIVVRNGKPVGGVEKITVKKGDRAAIQVSSPDTTDEIHLHGYDLKRNLKAGGQVRFVFKANADGIYVIELEGTGTQIGQLVVNP
jgi:FtsP/CotA-like multicopper oxidase with cupredoxin domain